LHLPLSPSQLLPQELAKLSEVELELVLLVFVLVFVLSEFVLLGFVLAFVLLGFVLLGFVLGFVLLDLVLDLALVLWLAVRLAIVWGKMLVKG
jgi:hypothetical protein